MSQIQVVNAELIAHFEKYGARVRTLAEPLTNDQFWAKPYPYGNSFGHLVLHLTGNLSYYIGTQIAGTGYVRDRPREFADAHPPSMTEALTRLDNAIAMVIDTVARQSASDWSLAYEGANSPDTKTRFAIVLQCASHLHHHVGQMIYLQKQWARA